MNSIIFHLVTSSLLSIEKTFIIQNNETKQINKKIMKMSTKMPESTVFTIMMTLLSRDIIIEGFKIYMYCLSKAGFMFSVEKKASKIY